MPQITLNLSNKTYARLEEYARNEAGELPARAARDILDRFFAEEYELDEEGDLLADPDSGWATLMNPDYANQQLTARQVEQEYGLQPGTVRGYIRNHPEMVESGEFVKADERTWLIKRIVAENIWDK